MFTSTGLALNRTQPSPLTLRREIVALLRGPAALPTMYLATNTFLRLGAWYSDNLSSLPQVTDAQANDFGTQQSGTFSVDVVRQPPQPIYLDPEPRLTHRAQVASGSGNAFVYHSFSALKYTIQPGDWLEYDVQVDPQSTETTAFTGAFEMDFSDGTSGRNYYLPDQIGVAMPGNNASALGAVSAWATRKFDLAVVTGKTVASWNFVNENDPASAISIVHYKNIRVTDGKNKTRLVVWASGNLTTNAIAYSLRSLQSTVYSPEALKLETITPVSTNAYTYWKISNGANRVVASGDYLEYEVFAPLSSADPVTEGGVEIDFTDATAGRGLGIVDQFGGLCVNGVSLANGAGNWVRRRLSLTAAVGKTIAFISVVSESDVAGRHTAYYRNMFISDSAGGFRQNVYAGGAPSLNTRNYENLNFNTALSVVNSTNMPGSFEEWLTAIKSQPVDLELITRVYREDNSTTDFISERRGIVKTVSRKRDARTLNMVDVDQELLKTQFPIKNVTTSDWPNLSSDFLNRPLAQGVGAGEKIPAVYVEPSVFKYVLCEVPSGMGTPTVSAVYRGTTVGQGSVVTDPYTVTTEIRGSGTTYLTLQFTREQKDFSNKLYVIEAFINAPGSRTPADELARLLTLIGVPIDPVSFAVASMYQAKIGVYIDAWYVTQSAAASYVDMLNMAGRSWLSQSVGGLYNLFMDKPRDAQKLFWDETDQIQINERTEADFNNTITLRSYPRLGKQLYKNDLSRTTSGSAGEKVFTNNFVRDAVVADALLDYLTKKEQRARVKGSLYGKYLNPGERVAVNSPLVLDGWMTLDAREILRVPDGYDVTFEVPASTDYTYTPGVIPSSAVDDNSPDYSYTYPGAPASVAAVSQSPGTASTYVLIRATPPSPSVNWVKLTGQVTNLTTNEKYTAQLVLNGGNYEATVPGLRPNQLHSLVAYATNANNLDGANVAGANFTTPILGVPSQPTALAVVSQGTSVIAGLGSAYALIRCTPPSGRWSNIRAQVTNAVTGEVYQLELLLVSSNYENTVANLRPNQTHNVVAWAINADGFESTFTSPVAFTSAALSAPNTPTSLAVITQGTTLTADGNAVAFALVRAVAPTNSWQRMIAQVTNTVSGETYQAQPQLNGANYEVTFGGLRPNVAHNVLVWAVNANTIESARSSNVAFNTNAYGTLPPTPGAIVIAQTTGSTLIVTVPEPVYAHHSRVLWEVNINSLGYTTLVQNGSRLTYPSAIVGASYVFRASFVDFSNNVGATTVSYGYTVIANITDTVINPSGVSAVSIGAAAINQGRTNTGTGAFSVSVAANTRVNTTVSKYAFSFSMLEVGTGGGAGPIYLLPSTDLTKVGGPDVARLSFFNSSTTTAGSVQLDYRTFVP